MKTHALAIAQQFLDSVIGSSKMQSGDPLPSIPALASQAGVSVVTMWKAVKELKRRGILEGSRGQATTIRNKSQLQQANSAAKKQLKVAGITPAAKNSWLRTHDLIQQDILKGVLHPGPLPPNKELRFRYGVSFPTLRKGLASLAADELIVVQGSGYRIQSPAEISKGAKIVMIVFADENKPEIKGNLNKEFVRYIETECANARIRLHIIAYIISNDTMRFVDFKTQKPCNLQKDNEALGYIFPVVDIDRHTLSIIGKIARFKKTACIVDQIGNWTLPADLQRNKYLKYFAIGLSDKPGASAARHLLSLGHRHIAYISPFHSANWSKQRFEGLEKTYAHASESNTVSIIELSRVMETDYLDDGIKVSGIDSLLQSYSAWKKRKPDWLSHYTDTFFSSQEGEFGFMLASAEIYRLLEPHLTRLLSDKKITALVAACDFAARVILDYLAAKKIAVPKQISVISFDDSPEALAMQLTSFNHNMHSLAHLVLSTILGRKGAPKATWANPAQIEGTIIERATTTVVLKS